MATVLLWLCPLYNVSGIIKSKQENWAVGSCGVFCVIFEANIDLMLAGIKENIF